MLQGATEVRRAFAHMSLASDMAKSGWRSIAIMAVVLIGTLDTKGHELAFVRDLLRAQGLETLVIDAGSVGPPGVRAGHRPGRGLPPGGDLVEAVMQRGDRGEAVSRGGRGVAPVVADLHRAGRVDGVFGLGGSAGTVIGTAAMRALPFGLPKVMVSTLASGQTRPFVGGSDIVMVHPVADLAGLNRLTRTALSQRGAWPWRAWSAGAEASAEDPDARAAGRRGDDVRRDDPLRRPGPGQARSRRAARWWSSTPRASAARRWRAWSATARSTALLDLTTTELADELVGGVLSAGPDRLEAGGPPGDSPGRQRRGARHGQLRARGRPSPSGSPAGCSTCTTRP